MRTRTLKQDCLVVAQIIAIAVCLSAPALAEAPKPTPSPSPQIIGAQNLQFAFSLEALAERAGKLVPLIQQTIENPLLPWLEHLGLGLAFIVMTVAFAKLWRENSGAGVDMLWWLARLGLIFALLGNGPRIINAMAATGKDISEGANRQGALATLTKTQKESFENSYSRFIQGAFKVNNEDVKSVPGGVVGVLVNVESAARDPERKLPNISVDMPFLFSSLNVSRGVITFGDFFLDMLSRFLMIAMRLASPIMIALAIDRGLAHKITYPFLWGVVVLTVIWPIVALIIKAIAYIGGNIAMSLGDGKEFYKFDQETMQIITNGGSGALYTVMFASVIMLISGLSLFGSPYIAYQLSVGRVYESVSQTVSGWAGALTGAGISYVNMMMAASVSRQADWKQADAQFESSKILTEAALKRDNLNTRAGLISNLAGARAGLVNQLAGIEAGRLQQHKLNEADKQFALTGLNEQSKLTNAGIWTNYDKSVKDGQARQEFEYQNLMTEKRASLTGLMGKGVGALFQFAGNARSTMGEGVGNLIGGSGVPGAKSIGSLINTGARLEGNAFNFMGTAAGFAFEYRAIQQRAAGRTEALNNYTQWTMRNEGHAAIRYDNAQGAYREGMKNATYDRGDAVYSAINAGADEATKGANKAYGISVGGYNQAYNLNMRGNQIGYDAGIKSATLVQDASKEAANLRLRSILLNSLGQSAAGMMKDAMTLRF